MMGVNSVTISYLIHYSSLLQNATDIITKCDRSLLQNVPGFLLQNVKLLLLNATIIIKCDNFTTKCDSYFKMRRLLQIATVQCCEFVKEKYC